MLQKYKKFGYTSVVVECFSLLIRFITLSSCSYINEPLGLLFNYYLQPKVRLRFAYGTPKVRLRYNIWGLTVILIEF